MMKQKKMMMMMGKKENRILYLVLGEGRVVNGSSDR